MLSQWRDVTLPRNYKTKCGQLASVSWIFYDCDDRQTYQKVHVLVIVVSPRRKNSQLLLVGTSMKQHISFSFSSSLQKTADCCKELTRYLATVSCIYHDDGQTPRDRVIKFGNLERRGARKRTKLAGLFVLAPATSIRTSGAHNPQDRMNPWCP